MRCKTQPKHKIRAISILNYLKSLNGKEISRADLLRHFAPREDLEHHFGKYSHLNSIYPYGKETKINERAISFLYTHPNVKVRKTLNNIWRISLSYK